MKELARAHRAMQADTLNSVVRALAVASVLRALRMRSLVRTLGLPVFADTDAVLVGAAARAGLPAEAADLYWCARQVVEAVSGPMTMHSRYVCRAGLAVLLVDDNVLVIGAAARTVLPAEAPGSVLVGCPLKGFS